MATVSRFSAVMSVPIPGTDKRFETEGYFAWVGWLALHLVYLVGFRNRLNTLINWFFAFSTAVRTQLAVTEQQVYARTAIGHLRTREQAHLRGGANRSVPTRRNRRPTPGRRKPIPRRADRRLDFWFGHGAIVASSISSTRRRVCAFSPSAVASDPPRCQAQAGGESLSVDLIIARIRVTGDAAGRAKAGPMGAGADT